MNTYSRNAQRMFKIHHGSPNWKLMEFFVRNPDEELTTKDAAVKSGQYPLKVTIGLSACVRDGYLTATPLPCKEGTPQYHTYRAGPNLGAAAAHMHSINAHVPRTPQWPQQQAA